MLRRTEGRTSRAPLHNPRNLASIRTCPDKLQCLPAWPSQRKVDAANAQMRTTCPTSEFDIAIYSSDKEQPIPPSHTHTNLTHPIFPCSRRFANHPRPCGQTGNGLFNPVRHDQDGESEKRTGIESSCQASVTMAEKPGLGGEGRGGVAGMAPAVAHHAGSGAHALQPPPPPPSSSFLYCFITERHDSFNVQCSRTFFFFFFFRLLFPSVSSTLIIMTRVHNFYTFTIRSK